MKPNMKSFISSKANIKNSLLVLAAAAGLVCTGNRALAQNVIDGLVFRDVREMGLPLANQCFKDCVKDLKVAQPIYYDSNMHRIPLEQADTTMPVTDGYYSRLPASIENHLRPAVWDLAQNSAGIAVRFRTNSANIGVKWTLQSNFRMYHMPTLGICGMDMYTYDNGRWRFVGIARPNGNQKTQSMIMTGKEAVMRDYVIFLPLYDGVIDMAIGVDKDAVIEMPSETGGNLFGGDKKKPLLFYGTSGTQGGCASRPGMVYTSILSRMMKRECVNLGFSGHGRMDSAVAKEMARIDAGAYILDCMGNCTIDGVRDSSDTFIRTLVTAHPETPVYMLSSYPWITLWMKKDMESYEAKDKVWREVFLKFREEGFRNLIFVDLKGTHNPDEPLEGSILGPDDECTVDGGHLSDMGFQRIANFLYPYFKDLQ